MARSIAYLLSGINLFVSTTMIFPLITSLIYHESQWKIFAIILSFCIVLSFFSLMVLKPSSLKVTHRASIAVAGLSWILIPVIGAIPFFLSGEIGNITDCYFESVSGFTTTGASILTKVEGISHGILLWRSLIQWLGGMGIVLVTVAFFSFLGAGGFELYKAEVPGPDKDQKLFPRISTMARTLWLTYIILTFAQIILLVIARMPLFDAICHTLTTMPTGGFSTKNNGINFYTSPYIQWIIIAFMIIAGTNFSLHATILRHKGTAYLKDPEFLCYLGFIVLGAGLLSFSRLPEASISKIENFIRENVFQVVSIMTTTGYASTDFEKWKNTSHLSEIIIVVWMFIGGMQGSTGGGIKVARLVIIFKLLFKELSLVIHPKSIKQITIYGQPIEIEVINRVTAFTAIYILIFVISSIILTITGLDIETAVTSAATSINNVGPGFGLVGPMDNYSQIPLLAKWVIICNMIIGRLEVFTVIVLIFPSFWKK